jgi:hypothetical protein
LCLAQFVLLAVLVLLWRQPPPAPPAGGPLKPESSAQREPYFAGQPGPWGELEYARINIELTDEFALAEENNFPQTRWFFAGQTRETALGLCASSGLSAAQCETLASPALWTAAPDGVVLAPPGELVLNLSPEVRARLYAELAHNPQNNLHAWPFVYRSGGFAEWFGNSGLSAQSLGLIQQVIYHRGTALCVSDLPELCARIPDRAERLRLIKTLSRTASLLMKVRLRPDTDVAALTAYWGRGWHMKDIEPLLASLTKVPGGITLDVAHLLPPFARKRLNSYPTPLEPGQRAPDCYWTAWNFFRDPPDDRYFDDTIWRQELQENCQLVELPTFGDLVFLTRPDGVPIHCAVFIADDVVFTKNGANLRQPWKLMKMEDLLARYPEDFPLRVAVFRPKYPNR